MAAWAVAAALAALCLPAAAPAAAFSSVPPPDAPHDVITREGAREAGWPEASIDALREAVRRPDTDEIEWDPDVDDPLRIDAGPEYQVRQHCDRYPGMDDQQAFDDTVRFIASARQGAASAAAAGDAGLAVARMGRALHALQDCFAHTNIIDLPKDRQEAFVRALLSGEPAPIEGLLLAGFAPGTDKPGEPEGDPYPHDTYAKDSAHKNEESEARLPDGRTKYEAARDMAINATAHVLREFLQGLGPEQREALGEVRPDPVPKRLPVPLSAFLAPGALVMALAVRRAR
ncbi:MAG TPA: hypothetical protein VFH47_07165 [Candidatus Thermoplasmatota archaeon]|nr:hypothetical protein [Candidatus Thermoplasmatota archaeon]